MMAKNIIQDVVAKNGRSIRQISINRSKRPPGSASSKFIAEEKETEPIRPVVRNKSRKINLQKMLIWTVAVLSLLFLLFSLSSGFATATVTIIPKVARVSFDDSYTARKNALPVELPFEVMNLSKKKSKRLEATETEDLQVRASGKIVVYNNFSSAPQKLIINTRFESEKGLVYKIPESIIVPGVKTAGDKKIPGSVETVIYAEEPGDKYNMKVADLKGDFKIVGFKGNKKYDYFYGRIKNDIAGGASGTIKKVSAKKSEETRNELRAALKEEIIKEAYSTKPDSFVLFEDAIFIDYVSLPDSELGGNQVEISETASLRGVIFDKEKLGDYAAKRELLDYDGAPVTLVLEEDARVNISSNNSKLKPWEAEGINLSIKGGANFIWTYDKSALQKALARRKKSDMNQILSRFSGIKVAYVKIRPFWKRSFPSAPEKIAIEDSIVKK